MSSFLNLQLSHKYVRLMVIAVILFGGFGLLSNPKAQGYEPIADPLVDSFQMLLAGVSPTTSPMTFIFLEQWRQWGLALVDIAKDNERAAMLGAITTYALLQVDKGAHMSQARAKLLVEKLRRDLEFYQERFPDFRTQGYTPSDPDEMRYFKRYQAIQQLLAKQGDTVQAKAKAVLDAVATLRERAKGKFILASLERQNGFLMRAVNDYAKALDDFEQAFNQLNEETGASPRQQMRVILNNKSPNLLFFVQVLSRDKSGGYSLRDDTRYWLPIYPKATPDQQAVEPKQPRGPQRLWLTVNPRDKVLLRVATMGPTRDRIRFMPVVGKQVRPDLNTLERGYYYLGYEAILPTQPAPLISRWYASSESYTWSLRGDWAPGEAGEAKIASSDSKEVRGFGPLKLSNDRLEWTLPASLEAASQIGKSTATVQGRAEFLKVGPTTKQQSTLEENASGVLEALLEVW